jgi:23S rRNA G2069 N7-methylase RlmK/C1962 C5-methylase RlmI
MFAILVDPPAMVNHSRMLSKAAEALDDINN